MRAGARLFCPHRPLPRPAARSPQNDNKPLWVRPPKEVGKEEYDSFFKTTFR